MYLWFPIYQKKTHTKQQWGKSIKHFRGRKEPEAKDFSPKEHTHIETSTDIHTLIQRKHASADVKYEYTWKKSLQCP